MSRESYEAELNELHEREAARCPETMDFVRDLIAELESPAWIKSVLVEFLRHSPDESHDAALLVYKIMAARVAEIDGVEFDDNDPLLNERGE
jgi:hypothetical protein